MKKRREKVPYYASLSSPEGRELDAKKRMIANGGWRCRKCGCINPSYTGSCGCGESKS